MVDETSVFEDEGVVALDGATEGRLPAAPVKDSEIEGAVWYESLGQMRAEGGRPDRWSRMRRRFGGRRG